jgi:hypothetical protein
MFLFVGVISAETVRRFSHAGRQTPLPAELLWDTLTDATETLSTAVEFLG